jgi:glycine betaine/choline ABC-type transport system substrate-binding protein
MDTETKELTEQRIREIIQEEIAQAEPNIDKISNTLANKLRATGVRQLE